MKLAIELLDRVIAGEAVTPEEAQAAKKELLESGSAGMIAGRRKDSRRLRAAANRLKDT